MQDAENQLFTDLNHIKELRDSKKIIQDELKKSLEENTHLHSAYVTLQEHARKELNELQEKLDASRREALAANQRLKSFKRDKINSSIKNLIYFSVS